MKKIINGKLYNTKTAEEIGYFWNGLSNRDFNEFEETLYLTKNGNYFLAGEGGPMTKYAKSNGNETWGSSDIVPLSKQEAFEWAQEYLDSDKVLKYFENMVKEA